MRLQIIALTLFFLALPVRAEDFKSTSFIIRDPLMTVHSGRSTSTNFDVYSSTGGFPLGESSSTNFAVRSGFLYYPTVTSPVLSGTGGQKEISLSWTASKVLSGLGWAVKAYHVGQTATPGGPYTFSNVGNVLLSTRTGLAIETNYSFIVRTFDMTDTVIATSSEITVATLGTGGGSGAGFAGATLSPRVVSVLSSARGVGVIISGIAYPGGRVALLKDAALVDDRATADGLFTFSLSGLSPGQYAFSVIGTDATLRRSPSVAIHVIVMAGSTTTVGGIIIPPTLSLENTRIRQGDTLFVRGASSRGAKVQVIVDGVPIVLSGIAGDDGAYVIAVDTTLLTLGDHIIAVSSKDRDIVSSVSQSLPFIVYVPPPVPAPPAPIIPKGDVNGDGKVNLVDFSIIARWYNDLVLSEDIKVVDREVLNGDGSINLADFSIMAYWWTG